MSLEASANADPMSSAEPQLREARGTETSPVSRPLEKSTVAPPKKKTRTAAFFKKANGNDSRRPCYLERMPLEILAEILSYVPYPPSILALARCSKYFCHALVNNSSTTFIWRNARKRCILASGRKLPEPTANFTEASYAAFVFDYGHCEICKSYVRLHYTSYSLRTRVCQHAKCRNTWEIERLVPLSTDDHPRYKGIKSWIPRADYTSSNPAPVRKQDWLDAVDEYNRALLEPDTLPEFLAKKQRLAKQVAAMHTLCIELIKFRDEWHASYLATLRSNESIAAKIASQEQWALHKLLGTRTFGLLHRSKSAVHELITHHDYMLIRDQVDQEMVEHLTRVARRQAEAAYQKRREDVAAHYTRLKSAPNPVEVLPALPEFRKLSVMKVMQGKPSDGEVGVAEELKHSKLVHELLTDNLNKWREEARSALAGVLGFAGWKSASKTKVHPVDRLTARFICKRCSSKRRGGEALTFADACGHRCAGLNKKQRSREAWSASLFEPDVKAIEVVNKILAAMGTTAEERNARTDVEQLQSRLLCTACPAPIAMSFEMAIHHGKRHDCPAFQIATIDDARIQLYGPCPLQVGLAKRLLASSTEERSKKRYACRHCQQASREAVSAEARTSSLIRNATVGATDKEAGQNSDPAPASNDDSAPQEDDSLPVMETQSNDVAAGTSAVIATPTEVLDTSQKKVARRAARMAKHQVFSFDGLRSHLKEKHRILHIGDEDIAVSPIMA